MRAKTVEIQRWRTLGIVWFAITAMCGCEDVITVNLKNAEPRLVIEGELIYYRSSSPYFQISRTTDFYNPNRVDGVSGASIILTDDHGNSDSLVERDPEHEPGVYVSYAFVFFPTVGETYHATVTVDGETYTASATMPNPIRIDSLQVEYQEGGGFGTEEDEGYRLHVYFQDAPDRSDYARIKLNTQRSRFLNYYLYDGRYSDGNVVDYEYFLNVFQPGDTVSAFLYSLDRTMYYYFQTLSEVWATEDATAFLDATPANPNTNWSGGALGYFGAFSVQVRSIVVPDNSRQ